MTRQEFLNEFAEMMMLPSATLTGRELLGSIGVWDSMQVLSFIAMVQQKFRITVEGSSVAEAKTVDDLAALVEDHFAEQGDLGRLSP